MHNGLWFTTLQFALCPHTPGQGSTHFLFTHAKFVGHSALVVHSGRHIGGFPIKDGKQEHTAWLFNSLHWLFAPHGDGIHGYIGSIWVTKIKKIYFIYMVIKKINNFITNGNLWGIFLSF